MKRLFLSLLLLAGCASTERKFSGSDRTRLFPDGVYHHDVRLTTADGKSHTFSGVVRISPALIGVVGLGPMNSTVFRLTENRATGHIDAKIYQAEMAKHEDRLVAFFRALRTLLLLKANAPKEQKLTGADGTIWIRIEALDSNSVPSRFRVEHEKFTVVVDVTGYDT